MSKTKDTADWTKAQQLRGIPISEIGSLYVQDRNQKIAQEKEDRKRSRYEGTARSVRFLEQPRQIDQIYIIQFNSQNWL